MQTFLDKEINNKVVINKKDETTFITDTFIVCRKIIHNYIEVTMTIRDMENAKFNSAYHLEFFDYASKYSGWYVCSKVEYYAPNKKNAVCMRIIPLLEEG
jgi:tRNA G10  N-methylase Trm11